MAENEEGNEGGMSTLKKTIIGIATTAVTAVGGYVATHIEAIFGGGEEEPKTEQVATPAAQPIINVNLENNNTNQQKQSGGTTVIRERVVEKPAEPAPKPKKEEEDPW